MISVSKHCAFCERKHYKKKHIHVDIIRTLKSTKVYIFFQIPLNTINYYKFVYRTNHSVFKIIKRKRKKML